LIWPDYADASGTGVAYIISRVIQRMLAALESGAEAIPSASIRYYGDVNDIYFGV